MCVSAEKHRLCRVWILILGEVIYHITEEQDNVFFFLEK